MLVSRQVGYMRLFKWITFLHLVVHTCRLNGRFTFDHLTCFSRMVSRSFRGPPGSRRDAITGEICFEKRENAKLHNTVIFE